MKTVSLLFIVALNLQLALCDFFYNSFHPSLNLRGLQLNGDAKQRSMCPNATELYTEVISTTEVYGEVAKQTAIMPPQLTDFIDYDGDGELENFAQIMNCSIVADTEEGEDGDAPGSSDGTDTNAGSDEGTAADGDASGSDNANSNTGEGGAGGTTANADSGSGSDGGGSGGGGGYGNEDKDWVLRLTPAIPNQVGSVWHKIKQPLELGFDVRFKFRLSYPSYVCTKELELNEMETLRYQECSFDEQRFSGEAFENTRRGGDGFAFVIQNNPNRTKTIGSKGSGLGYNGVRNSLAVEFDTYSNQAIGESYLQHISVSSGGEQITYAGNEDRLTPDFPVYDLVNGEEHSVRIRFTPGINETLIARGKLTGHANLAAFLHPNIGTFCVHYDNDDDPFFCFPIDLGNCMALDSGKAYLGFTASTGSMYQIHDILSWRYCASSECPDT